MGNIKFRMELKRLIGLNFTLHRKIDEGYLVNMKTKENAEKFDKLNRIGNFSIVKRRDFHRNSSQVTVFLIRNLQEVTVMEGEGEDVNEVLKEALIEEGLPVEKIVYFTRNSRRGQRRTYLMFLRITVNSRNPIRRNSTRL